MDDLNIEALGLEIAGVDVHSLMRDLDEIELAVSELTLYGQFYEHFKEGFGLIQHGRHPAHNHHLLRVAGGMAFGGVWRQLQDCC